jgi:hypothetical protein
MVYYNAAKFELHIYKSINLMKAFVKPKSSIFKLGRLSIVHKIWRSGISYTVITMEKYFAHKKLSTYSLY